MVIPDLTPKTLAVKGVGWFYGSNAKPLRNPLDEQQQAFFDYSMMGLMDPKMPVELKVMGPGYVAFNVLGVGALLWYVDPLRKREGGLDDVWYSGFNPTYNWPSLAWDEATSWVPDEPEYWGDW